MSSIKLHYYPDATSLATHILLHETNLTFHAIEYKPTPEGLSELQRINPKARVPVLVIDDQVITESTAIMTAIAQHAPEKHLLGRTDLETVRVCEWLNWLSGTLHGQAWVAIFRPERFSDEASAHEAIRAKGMAAAREMYAMVEERLDGLHAVGDNLTVVDPFLYVFYRWGASREMVSKETHPKFWRLVSQLVQMPSVRKALEVERISDIDL